MENQLIAALRDIADKMERGEFFAHPEHGVLIVGREGNGDKMCAAYLGTSEAPNHTGIVLATGGIRIFVANDIAEYNAAAAEHEDEVHGDEKLGRVQ